MSSPQSHLDEFDDEQFACLLGRSFDGPSMDRDFAASLGTKLDRAFVERAPSQAAVISFRVARHRRRWWRWPLVAAASLLLILGIFSNRPSYSWSQMVEAMRTKPWVQTETQPNSGTKVVRWISIARRVTAERSDAGVALTDWSNGTELRYDRGADTVLQSPISDKSRAESLPEALSILLPKFQAAGPVTLEDLTVVEQKWQRTDANQVELQVTLQHKSHPSRSVRAAFVLDPETHLPVSCRLLEDSDSSMQVSFQYPSEGPQSIYSLGVPKDVQIVSVATVNDVARVEPKVQVPDPQPDVKTPETNVPQETPTAGDMLAGQVDAALETAWQKAAISPARPATDEEFLRRVYLDLIGRIPTVGEARMFLEDAAEDRRSRLVEKLLQSRDHATYFAGVWRRMLIPDGVDLAPYGGPQRLDQWLADHFQNNTPYDKLVSELLLAEGRIGQSGPLLFYAALKLNPEELAAQSSRVFLGTRLECAQCHNHPFDSRISQQDFWGFAALFARISRPQGKMVVASPVLLVRDTERGEVKLPDSETVVPPQLPLTQRAVSDEAGGPSRRRQLVDWLTSADNQQFSRATVNRVWAQLFGRGFVEPVDDILPQNAAACPEVFDLLAQEFTASGFDIRSLVRTLVSTKAYQLSSQAEADSLARTLVFAQMNIKPFSAEQLYDCISVASGGKSSTNVAGDGAGLFRVGNQNRESFVQLFHVPGGRTIDYQSGIPQALTLMHGQLVHSATDLRTSGVLESLSAPFFTDEQRIETLFLATLSRQPSAAEREQMLALFGPAQSSDERRQQLSDVLWALVNTAEFTLNH